ncbi:MAG: hypothetical protein KKD63_06070 [Proteobacteria bacterium]|nr:hypothetical protein [Desulfobulbaceae bacterium]MBU4152426.1 hypothetical protein [Pseudomonadota bacterium]MDP2106400.1 hypothetical protein [Desulfobulbaceae bacterium]
MKKQKKSIPDSKGKALKSEHAMIAGIMEGSPDAIGVAVIRMECGCRKMAAVDKNGEPASKVIAYRDQAESVCPKCKEDNGAFHRVTESFIDWASSELDEAERSAIEVKVLGSKPIPN